MHHSQAASFHEGQRGSLPCPCPILLQNTQSHLIRVKINFYIHPNKFNDFGLNPTPCLYGGQCDQKKSPNVYKICPKMILQEKLKILAPLQKLHKNEEI